jgi:CRP/FNR family cyclic AMP-dependent transcriptional regulator
MHRSESGQKWPCKKSEGLSGYRQKTETILRMKDVFSPEGLREYADSEAVFQEGDHSFEMYVVQSGHVVVSQGGVEIAVLGPGEFFGEMSLLESLPRSATVRARGHARLYCVQPGGFLLKIRRDPTFAFELMQSLSRRLRLGNERASPPGRGVRKDAA